MTLYWYKFEFAVFLLSVGNTQGIGIEMSLIARRDEKSVGLYGPDNEITEIGAISGRHDGPESPVSHLEDGTKAAITIGLILGVLALAAAGCMGVRHLRRRRRNRRAATDFHKMPPFGPSASNGGPPGDTHHPRPLTPRSTRPWFDLGVGSTELPAEETRGVGGQGRVGGWAVRKGKALAPVYRAVAPPGALPPPADGRMPASEAELAAAEESATYEVPGARGTWVLPVELPAAVLGPGESGMVSGGRVPTKGTSLRTVRTQGSPTPTWRTSLPDRGMEELVSPCSTYDEKYLFNVNKL